MELENNSEMAIMPQILCVSGEEGLQSEECCNLFGVHILANPKYFQIFQVMLNSG